jgi:hypothetical protein
VIRDGAGNVVDVEPAGKVAPGIGEHLLQQIPQYTALKSAIGGGRTFDTSTLLDVLGGGGVQRDQTGAPRYPTGPLDQLLRLSGVTTYDYNLEGFQENLEEQRQRALAAALSRFGQG